jgi:hypothetical protein
VSHGTSGTPLSRSVLAYREGNVPADVELEGAALLALSR